MQQNKIKWWGFWIPIQLHEGRPVHRLMYLRVPYLTRSVTVSFSINIWCHEIIYKCSLNKLSIIYFSGTHIIQKFRSHFETLGARWVAWPKFYAEDLQMLGNTVQNLAARANCYLEFVLPCSGFLFTCANSETTEHVSTEFVSKKVYIKRFRACLIVVPITAV
jgi:hypothetical protein